ncbi:MAG: hypothetical protein JST01_23850 [Cyanobacteria bacterium SZAS TMP-1]|nr:hypothetical protein [Cyanobacteria bacterium SZAS TMP-1]
MSNSQTPKTNKPVKPCPRCGSAAGKGNGGSQCLCKKGKKADGKNVAAPQPEPCDAPIGKDPAKSATPAKGGCGCGGSK